MYKIKEKDNLLDNLFSGVATVVVTIGLVYFAIFVAQDNFSAKYIMILATINSVVPAFILPKFFKIFFVIKKQH